MTLLAISSGWNPPIGGMIALLVVGLGVLALLRTFGLIPPRYERLGRRALLLGLLVGLFAFWMITRPVPRPPRLAVIALQPGSPSIRPAGWGAGIAHATVDLLRFALPSGLRVSAIDEVNAAVARGAVTDVPSALAAGIRLGARYVLFGEYEAAPQGILLHAHILDVHDTTVTSRDMVCAPDTLSRVPLRLIRALGRRIPALSAADSTLRLPLPLPPPEAFRQYCRGVALFETRTEDGYWEAIQAYRTALAIDSTYALPYLGLAYVYKSWQRKGRKYRTNNAMMRRKALENAGTALRLDPRLNEAYRLIAAVQMSFKNWKAASAVLKKGIAADPKEPLNYVMLSKLRPERFQDIGFKNEASLCERAVQLNPASVSLRVSLEQAYVSHGKFHDAVAAGKKAVELGPSIIEAYTALGDAYIFSNKAFPARDLYSEALKLDPGNQDLYIGLATAYTLRQERDLAIETYHRAIAALPEHADLYYNLGVLYQRTGQWEKAVPWFEKAVEVGDHPNAHFYLARWYEKQGDRAKAIEHWTARVRLGDPDEEWTRDAMRHLAVLSPSASRAIGATH